MQNRIRPHTAALALLGLTTVTSADVLVLHADQDNTLYEHVGGRRSNGAGRYFFSGKNAEGLLRRGLIRFDVAGALPAGSTVESVRLILAMNRTNAAVQDVSLHEVQADWGEGDSNDSGPEGAGAPAEPGDATWLHTFYDTSFWATAGGDFAPLASATLAVDQEATYTWGSTAELVADVQGWLEDASTNFGWVLVHDDEATLQTAKRYTSRDSPDVELWPRLEIGYAPPGGCSTLPYCSANPNSTGVSARLFLRGSCSIAAGDFTLVAQPVPDQPGLFFFADNPTQSVFGGGYLCADGGTRRLEPVVRGSAGEAHLSLDLAAVGVSPGARYFQYWYRDPIAGASGFNLSDGIQVGLVP